MVARLLPFHIKQLGSKDEAVIIEEEGKIIFIFWI